MHSRSRLTSAGIAGAVLGVAVLGGAPAVAAWTKSGAGEGAAEATSLVVPTDVSAAGTSNTTMSITWSAPGQLNSATYQVVRNGTTTLSCTSSPCSDTNLTAGTTYSYVVSAKLGSNWSKSASSVSGTTNASLAGTTTTVQPTTPTKSGATVTLTAAVAPSGATGTITFRDNGTTIACTGGNARPIHSGSATCQTSFTTVGAHPITALYSGDSTYATSTSSAVTQRVVNHNVNGLAFTNVKVGGTAVTPSCSNANTGNVTCTVSGGNNAVVDTNVAFVNGSGVATFYASDAATSLAYVANGKTPVNSTLSVAANATTAIGTASATKSGSNAAAVTITLSDGANSFTATLTVN
jgi:hypothetical protein